MSSLHFHTAYTLFDLPSGGWKNNKISIIMQSTSASHTFRRLIPNRKLFSSKPKLVEKKKIYCPALNFWSAKLAENICIKTNVTARNQMKAKLWTEEKNKTENLIRKYNKQNVVQNYLEICEVRITVSFLSHWEHGRFRLLGPRHDWPSFWPK